MEDKKSYLQSLAQQLQDWDKEMDELKLKAGSAKSGAKAEFQKQLDELRVKRDTAQAKFLELQKVGDEAWEEMKEGLEKSWTELKTSFRSAVSKFKQNND
ncbi:MAG: coiled coil domain-containing protein [bacterium]